MSPVVCALVTHDSFNNNYKALASYNYTYIFYYNNIIIIFFLRSHIGSKGIGGWERPQFWGAISIFAPTRCLSRPPENVFINAMRSKVVSITASGRPDVQ